MPLFSFSTDPDDYTDHQKRNMWTSIHVDRTCPICGASNSFLVGPYAGGSMNIECSPCRTIFWTTPFSQFGSYPVGISAFYKTERSLTDDQNTHTG